MLKFRILYYLSTRNFIPGFNIVHHLISRILKKFISKKYFLILNLNKKTSYSNYSYKYSSYAQYKQWQKYGNLLKEKSVWVTEYNIKKIVKNLNFNKKKISVLCLGTRNGTEQKYFKKYLPKNSYILGLEISNTAKKYKDTIQWDFNIYNSKFKKKFDILYSNSHDHMYNKIKTLNIWMKYLKSGGILALDQAASHGRLYNDIMDPTSFETELLPYEILKITNNSLYPIKMLSLDKDTKNMRRKIFLFKHV